MPNSPTKDIFLSLLKIYLEPPPAQQRLSQQPSLLKPALELISRQSPRLDTLETLRLLPPLVPAQDVRAFLFDAARAPVFDTKVVREVRKGYNEQVARRLMALEGRRVRVTDSRMYVLLILRMIIRLLREFHDIDALNATRGLALASSPYTLRGVKSLTISVVRHSQLRKGALSKCMRTDYGHISLLSLQLCVEFVYHGVDLLSCTYYVRHRTLLYH